MLPPAAVKSTLYAYPFLSYSVLAPQVDGQFVLLFAGENASPLDWLPSSVWTEPQKPWLFHCGPVWTEPEGDDGTPLRPLLLPAVVQAECVAVRSKQPTP